MSVMATQFRCIIHGSFSKHFDEIRRAVEVFRSAGIEVLAPKDGELKPGPDGFALFDDEVGQDPRLVELLYLHNLKRLGRNGFSYFVNPDGYIGASASYELGIAQLTNVQCFFSHKLSDHPAYTHHRSVRSADALADYIMSKQSLPHSYVKSNERYIHKLWEDLMVPGSIVATGAIIEHQTRSSSSEKEVLLVKTHKWGHRYSIVGGKVRRNERLDSALLREVMEETKLKGAVGRHICTFDQIKGSGYYRGGVQHIFVDHVVQVESKAVELNHEAQDYLWVRPSDALAELDIEPNARTTLELYLGQLLVRSP